VEIFKLFLTSSALRLNAPPSNSVPKFKLSSEQWQRRGCRAVAMTCQPGRGQCNQCAEFLSLVLSDLCTEFPTIPSFPAIHSPLLVFLTSDVWRTGPHDSIKENSSSI
jgi:hypothetical protein